VTYFIWNAHWATLGGGEVYAATLATVLRDSNENVVLLGLVESPLKDIEARLGINLYNINYYKISGESEISLLLNSEDTFINGSFGSQLRAPTRKSIYICHFPTINLKRRLTSFSHRKVGLRAFGPVGQELFSIDDSVLLYGSGKLVLDYKTRITLICHGGLVVISNDDGEKIVMKKSEIMELEGIGEWNIENYSTQLSVTEVKGNFSRRYFMRYLTNIFYMEKSFASSYKQIWANSDFTSQYVLKYWGIESDVVYPPVSNDFELAKEKNAYQIVSIGRFMSPKNGHSKNQLDLVEAFNQLSERSDKPWKLYLIGGVDKRNSDYFNLVKSATEKSSVDITLLPNCDNTTLKRVLQDSTYYWHAGGYGIRKNKPEKMEHFGITVVESLNASVIPIVFDIAGPAEVLRDFPNLRYKSLRELVDITNELSTLTEKEKNSLDLALRDLAIRFTPAKFREKVLSQLRRIKEE
jgi:glycosyltransferase involved in cell wall biosynthesis